MEIEGEPVALDVDFNIISGQSKHRLESASKFSCPYTIKNTLLQNGFV